MTQLAESDYRTAQAGDAKVRQEFLDAIDFGDKGEFVRKVIYDPDCSLYYSRTFHYRSFEDFKKNVGASLTSPKLFRRFITKKSDVVVFPSIWKYSFGMLKSIICDHEEYHAVFDAKNGGSIAMKSLFGLENPSVTYTYFSNLNEVLARFAQLESANSRNLTIDERQLLVSGIDKKLSMAEDLAGKRDIQKDLDSLYLPSPRDTMARERLPSLLIHSVS